jgi:pimeloyl-ACP methyl ester carboxylesterase
MAEFTNSTALCAISLLDGRRLAFSEYGDPKGHALFYFHGQPGSRFEAQILATEAARQGIRLISVDRPGIGGSTYKPRRRLTDWPNDVAELADTLQINRYSVIGFSGGGPYALACAYKSADRVITCGLVSTAGCASALLGLFVRSLPWIILPLAARLFSDQERGKWVLNFAARRWSGAEKKALALVPVHETLAASLVEAFRQGTKGVAYDCALLGKRWGFVLDDIRVAVHLWHGDQDKIVSVAAAHHIEARLSNRMASYFPDEGHFSTIVNHQREILSAFLSAFSVAQLPRALSVRVGT